MSNKRLLKSTGVISLATLCSRVLGFVRDMLTANLFGTTIFAQAFVVSFRIPNLLRDLVGEGAANAAFVPILTEYYATRSKEEFWNLAKNLLYILSVILIAISLSGILLSPIIVRLIAPGFIEDPQKLEITIKLTRIVFPFIFLIGLVAFGMGVLNSLNHFAAPAFGAVLLNVSMIFFLIYVCPKIGITGLAIAVLVGGVLEVVLIGLVLRKKGLTYSMPGMKSFPSPAWNRALIHPAIKRIWKLLVPRFFGSAVYQLSVIVDNIFSTFEWIVGIGAPAALWYSYRLFHLPLAIFGVALATVALPKMSKEVATDDISSFKETINFSIRGVFFMLVPASIGLATLGRSIIRILFERGAFTSYSTSITNNALFFYAFGLFACGGIKILVNSFFSIGDTRTPVKTAAAALFINVVLNYILMWPLKIGGLALATSIAAISNFVMLYILLVRRIGDIGTQRILNYFVRIVIASALMGIFTCMGGGLLNKVDAGILVDIAGILLITLLSIAIYIVLASILGIDEIKKFIRWILKRD